MIPGTPENKGWFPPKDVPFAVEHKMGFAPKLHCICGASIDTKEGRLAIGRFKLMHEECQPVTQDVHKISGK